MINILSAGFLSAWLLTASPQAPLPAREITCEFTHTGVATSATATSGDSEDEVDIGLTLGTSQSPASYMHEYEIVVQLSRTLAQGAVVTVDFSGGWVQGSNNYGSVSLNAQRTEVIVHYTLPSCGYQSGSGFVAAVHVDNNGQKLNNNGLISSSGGDLIILIDP